MNAATLYSYAPTVGASHLVAGTNVSSTMMQHQPFAVIPYPSVPYVNAIMHVLDTAHDTWEQHTNSCPADEEIHWAHFAL